MGCGEGGWAGWGEGKWGQVEVDGRGGVKVGGVGWGEGGWGVKVSGAGGGGWGGVGWRWMGG